MKTSTSYSERTLKPITLFERLNSNNGSRKSLTFNKTSEHFKKQSSELSIVDNIKMGPIMLK